MVTKDFKTFFSSLSVGSGSSSRVSTHESQIVAVAAVEVEEVVERQTVASVEVETEQEQPQPQGLDEDDSGGTNLIREFDPNVHIIADPRLRIPIDRFHPNIRDDVKRAYLVKGPIQLRCHAFPRNNYRGFRATWFDQYDWLEYSVSKDAAYCFYCFLFRKEAKHGKFGHEAFSKTGYDNWKHVAHRGLPEHCRVVDGFHNKARQCVEDFTNQRSSISRKFESNTIDAEKRYEVCVTTALDIA